VRTGNDLARVHATGRVEGPPKPILVIEVVRGEHEAHVLLLFYADAVFARQDSPDVERRQNNLSTCFVDAIEDTGLTRIEQQQG